MPYLQEACGSCTHARMQVCLGALDVVVQVVAEGVDQIDRTVTIFELQVTGKQNWRARGCMGPVRGIL